MLLSPSRFPRRRVSSSVWLALAVLVSTTTACGPDNGIVPVGSAEHVPTNTFTLAPNTLSADASVARDVVVRTGSLSMPLAGNEHLLAELQHGTIFYGDRAPGMPATNPLGFLVKVQSVEQVGERLHVLTEPAEPQELFTQADFGFPLTDATASGVGTQQDAPASEAPYDFRMPIRFNFGELWKNGASQGNLGVSQKATVEGGVILDLAARGMITWQKHEDSWWPSASLSFDCNGGLIIGACTKIESELKAGMQKHDGLVAFDDKVHDLVADYTAPEVAVPVPAPFPATIKYQAKILCGLKSSKELGAAYVYKNHLKFDGKVGIDRGTPYGSFRGSVGDGSHRWEFVLKGGMKLECGVSIKIGVFFFDRVGLFLRVVPGAELGVSGSVKVSGGTGQPEGAKPLDQVQACASFDAKLDVFGGGEAGIGWAVLGGEISLASERYPFPFPMRACTSDFEPSDSCVGKTDGQYCSAIDTRSAYGCKDGGTVPGDSCGAGAYCQSKSQEMGGSAKTIGDDLVCGATPPSVAELALGFCPTIDNLVQREPAGSPPR